jgi:hypothetical protein
MAAAEYFFVAFEVGPFTYAVVRIMFCAGREDEVSGKNKIEAKGAVVPAQEACQEIHTQFFQNWPAVRHEVASLDAELHDESRSAQSHSSFRHGDNQFVQQPVDFHLVFPQRPDFLVIAPFRHCVLAVLRRRLTLYEEHRIAQATFPVHCGNWEWRSNYGFFIPKGPQQINKKRNRTSGECECDRVHGRNVKLRYETQQKS